MLCFGAKPIRIGYRVTEQFSNVENNIKQKNLNSFFGNISKRIICNNPLVLLDHFGYLVTEFQAIYQYWKQYKTYKTQSLSISQKQYMWYPTHYPWSCRHKWLNGLSLSWLYLNYFISNRSHDVLPLQIYRAQRDTYCTYTVLGRLYSFMPSFKELC